jgi:uncharacterized coiled-coil protein SlyX
MNHRVDVVSSDIDLFAAERAMIDSIGLFRSIKPQATVESLLQDRILQRERESRNPATERTASTIISYIAPNQYQSPNNSSLFQRSSHSSQPASSTQQQPLSPRLSSRPISTVSTSPASSDFALISSLTARLTTLEKIASKQSKLISQKDENLAALQQQIDNYELVLKEKGNNTEEESSANHANSEALAALEQYQQENNKLKRQIFEMENFLNDYGLVWVGYKADQDAADDSPSEPAISPANSSEYKEIYFDMTAMIECIKQLNLLAGESQLKIIKSGSNSAKFSPPPALSLIFYRDGLFFRNGPLRRYHLAECETFCRDLLEGYFPYELKAEFPDGVVFNVTDKSSELYSKSSEIPSNFKAFGGVGNRLGENHPAVGREKFLQSLPVSVISNGSVIDIRSDIAKLLNNGNNNVKLSEKQLIETPTLILLREESNRHSAASRPQTPRTIATLQVKLDTANTPLLLLKMRFEDSLRELHGIIAVEREKRGVKGEFELRSAFPAKLYASNDCTLMQVGLTPNANLFVRAIAK